MQGPRSLKKKKKKKSTNDVPSLTDGPHQLWEVWGVRRRDTGRKDLKEKRSEGGERCPVTRQLQEGKGLTPQGNTADETW